MQSRLRLGGHALQPLLLMFPLGLFAMALAFDLATQFGAPDMVGTLGYWTIVAGLVGGSAAALGTWFDAISAGRPAFARTGFLRLLLDLGVLVFFAVIALIRMRTPDRGVDPGPLLLELFGLTAATYSAWFGGRLDPNRPPGMRRGPSSRANDATGISTTRREAA